MTIPDTRTDTPDTARMLAMADHLFTEFDHLPARNVFTAIAAATTTLKEHHQSPLPGPDQIELLAREQLRRKHSPRSAQ